MLEIFAKIANIATLVKFSHNKAALVPKFAKLSCPEPTWLLIIFANLRVIKFILFYSIRFKSPKYFFFQIFALLIINEGAFFDLPSWI